MLTFNRYSFGFKKGALDIPTACESVFNNGSLHSEMLAQLGQTRSFAAHSQNTIVSFISLLPNRCRPHNVCRTVASIIVNTFQFPSFLAFAHVFQKVFKRKPSVTHINTTASIPTEHRIVCVKTPAFHPCPEDINTTSCDVAMPSISMCPSQLSRHFTFKTPARVASPANEIAIEHGNFITAIASAKAHSLGASARLNMRFGFGNHNKSSKAFPNDVDSGRHNVGSVNVVFSGDIWPSTRCRYDSSNNIGSLSTL